MDENYFKNKFVRGSVGITVTYVVDIKNPIKFSEIYRNWDDYIDNNEEIIFQGLTRCDCVIGDKPEHITLK
jgi:hypothetical protein